MMLKSIFCLFVIFIKTGCSSYTEPNEINTSSEFYPLAIGNYWGYEESFSSEDTIYILNYRSIVTKIENIGGYKWFKIESTKNNYTQKIHLLTENDSVYMLQYQWQNPIRALNYIIPKVKKESFHSLLGGDVGIIKTVEKLDTTIQTNIGEFSNCFRYKYGTLDWTVIEVLVYGIGIVESQIISYNLNGDEISKTVTKIENARIDNMSYPTIQCRRY